MAVVQPAWKLALLERKKRQEEMENAKQVHEEEKKLASLPAWKRAILLRENQAQISGKLLAGASVVASHAGEQRSEKWQVAVKRVKGPDSPILKKTSWASSPNPSEAGLNSTSPLKQPATMCLSGFSARSLSEKSHCKSARAEVHTQARSLSYATNITASSVMPTPAPAAYSAPAAKHMEPAKLRADVEGPKLAALPAWKKELVIKKQKKQQKIAMADSTKRELVGEEATHSGEMFSGEPRSFAIRKESEPFPAQTNPSTHQQQQPEVVNRASNKIGEQRLIEQEGKTLHPPIYKEVAQWANVREDDDKFKNLPLWKQALIRRRRADRALRSGQPRLTTLKVGDAPKGTLAMPPAGKTTSPHGSKKSSRMQPETTSQTSFHPRQGKATAGKSSHQLSQEITSNVGNKSSPENRPIRSGAALKPGRKAPSLPLVHPKKGETMFTCNFSKSSRHCMDTGCSSDSTDSELEEAVVTHLDELSDESDSGGVVLQNYTPSGRKERSSRGSPQNTSIMADPVKNKKMQHVSWSDSNLVKEHTYPQYDYSDYDYLDQEELHNRNVGFSHPLHPSLGLASSACPYSPGYNSSRYLRDGTMGSFAFSAIHPSVVSDGHVDMSYPHEVWERDTAKKSSHSEEDQTAHHYTDHAPDAAALLW